MVSSKSVGREKWRGASEVSRLREFFSIFITHKSVNDVVTWVRKELPHRQAAGKACALLVIGASGSGKTHLVSYLESLYPDIVTPELTQRRIIRFKIPKTPSPKTMSSALLRAIGDPLSSKGTADDLWERVCKLLQNSHTVIICIDDFQDIPDKRSARGVKLAAAWVRDLCEVTFPGVVIALGTESAIAVRDSDEQLGRRMQAEIRLGEFSLDNPKSTNSFRTVLEHIDAALPIAESSELSTSDLIYRISAATNGNFDYLMKLLLKSLTRAIERGSEKIEIIDLENGFNDQHQVLAFNSNPFSKE